MAIINKVKNKKIKPKKSLAKRIFRFVLKTILILLVLFVLLVLFIRSPWGQNIIVDKVTAYVSKEIGTPFQIDKFYLTFQGNLAIDGIYLEDQAKDTLLYSKELEIDIPILPILQKNEIRLQNLNWTGLVANVNRTASTENFNFQYIIDAFASENETETEKEESQAYTFDVKNINLADFNLSYVDELEGMDTSLQLGKLQLAFENFDLESLDFHLKKWYVSDTKIVYHQGKLEEVEDDTPDKIENSEKVKLPVFLLNELVFENVDIDFIDNNSGLKLNSNLADFKLIEAFANLNEDEFKLEKFHLTDSFVEINLPKSDKQSESLEQENSNFVWPAYAVQLDELNLTENRFQYTQGEQKIRPNNFDETAIEVTHFNLNLTDFTLAKEEQTSFKLNKLNFSESSGFQLNDLSFQFLLNGQQMNLNSFAFQTRRNKVDAEVNLQFNELSKWIEDPQTFQHTNFSVNANLNLAEFISVYPDLKKIDYIQEISKNPLILNVQSNGNLRRLALPQLNVKWASTHLKANGNFTHLTNLDKLTYQLKNFNFTSNKKDISRFVKLDEGSFNLPEKMNLSGYAKGDLNNIKTESLLRIPEGELKLFADLKQKNEIRLTTELELVKMDLGKLFNQAELEPVSLVLSANAAGKDWLELEGELNSKFSQLTYASFDFSDLDFSGKIADKNATVRIGLDHKDIRFTALAEAELDSIHPKADLVFDLQGADLGKLGLTKKDIRARTKLNAHFSGNAEKFEFSSSVDSTLVVFDNESYELKKIDLKLEVDENKTDFTTNSRFLSTEFQANAHPNEFADALLEYYQFYKSDQSEFRETEHPVEMKLKMRFHATRFISEVMLEGIEELDTLSVDFEFIEQKHQLNAELRLPKLIYNQNQLDSLAFSVHTDVHKADFSLGFASLKASVLEVAKTRLYGDYEDQKMHLNFEAFKDEVEFFNINSLFHFREDETAFSVLPDKLILNEKPWQISPDNMVKLLSGEAKKELQFNAFELTRNQQYFGIRNDFDIEKDHIGIAFKDFKLSTLTSYLNTEENFAKGIISGDLVLVNPFDKMGIISDLEIDKLELLENAIGKLSLEAASDFDDTYQMNLDLTGDEIKFHASGNIDNTTGTPKYTIDADLEKLQLQLIEKFAEYYITDTKGKIAAKFELQGSANELDYFGSLSFLDTELRVKTLNALFKLGDEKIKFDKNKIYLNNFNLKDIKDNAFSLNGDIDITELLKPKFNINAKTSSFEVLNSTQKDNDLYFGKVVFDADFTLKGSIEFPKLEGELAFKESTDITYIVPQSQVGTVEREGVVLFVNKKNPENILTRQDSERFNAVISGIEIKSLLKIHPKTKAKVIINKRTGDNVKLVGGGDLKFNMARNGNMTLFGKYEVNEGQFELNLYNLVTRRFQIAEGSSINWSGDPLNADLDIRAIYNIETSASSLMASQTSAESPTVQNQYRQQLPFNVYLDVGGEINAPELNFQLDMPENERAAINGTVYNRVMQINQQDGELNKQVFSLLVLNRFYPDSGSDGSQGGAASIARNNINQALSDQLNTYANKLTGNTGIQLNFDVNSYTDFQSGQANNRTDVDISAQKSLMNDRLIVEAGSQVNVEGDLRPGESNVALGNVSVQYLITQDGRWKIRGFRRSEYENVIDGQVFISGIALIFTREFNQFKELWAKRFMEDQEEDEVEEEDQSDEIPNSASENNPKANLPIEEQDHE